MSTLKSGDTVVFQGYHGRLRNGGVYTVAVKFGLTCSLVGVNGSFPTHEFSKVSTAQHKEPTEQPVLTPQEVFTAILQGIPLEYRVITRSTRTEWYTLTNPESIAIADVKHTEFRKQVQTVNLSGTVPKPVPYDSIEITDTVYTVYFSTMKVAVLIGKYAQAGGLYWRTRAQAEQFRDALTECFSTVPVPD